jgi:hypothetical protein
MPNIKRIDPIAIAGGLSQSRPLTTMTNPAGIADFLEFRGVAGLGQAETRFAHKGRY